MDAYRDYRELQKYEEEGRDYAVLVHRRSADFAIMAPHGGEIEPGTSEVAEAIAGNDYSFYTFEGRRALGNWALHVKSTNFDEPRGVLAARSVRRVVAIHGCGGVEPIVYAGGRDLRLKDLARDELRKAGFRVHEHWVMRGLRRENLCNRCGDGKGIQLELTRGLRRSMFNKLSPGTERLAGTTVFEGFVAAVRRALGRLKQEWLEEDR
jgi:phage replication-related protein YjqB (UPF0714/DUF867 family)